MAPEVVLDSGNKLGANPLQLQLWEWWQEACAWATEMIDDEPALAMLNGDAIEGVHHGGKQVVATQAEQHVQIARQTLQPFLKLAVDGATFITRGTECHTTWLEGLLCERLGLQAPRDEWLIRVHGCLVSAKHHMTVTSRPYLEASAMSILMGAARLNCLRAGHEVPKVFLRAHRHCGGHFNDGAGVFGVTGGWQFLTRHGHKVVPESIPSPTMLVLDWRGAAEGDLPILWEKRFQPPQPEILE